VQKKYLLVPEFWGNVKALLNRTYRHICSECKKLYFSRKALEAKIKLRTFSRPLKLHLGCGRVRLKDWVNIDSDTSLGTADIVWDLTRGIPVDNSSCKLVYCEHLLEHFTVEQGLSLLRECYRVLEPGGVLRVAMPSLDVLIKDSYLGSWRGQDWLSWPQYQFIETRAEMLNIAFRGWGHKWLYDQEELHRRLKESGFKDIRDAEWGTSDIDDFTGLEIRKDSLLICEAKKE
jgi:predicted SAM-dependent methyltransferase